MAKINFFKTAVAAAACSMLFAACGDDSSSSSKPETSVESSASEDDGSSTSKDEVVSISDKSISGVSQKGPFVTGSTVTLYELDKNFKQTGKSFAGDIASDDGAFKIDAVELASQYAFLKANGYYRNEVTGKKSAGTITLNAITDLSDREKVNVNLLTHLEYERAMYLVENDTLSVAEAKAQAEKEIFKAFGIEGNFDNSEDLDIFSKGEGNAALLAISVLMQGDRSEADLTEFLKKFASDIKEDGTWDDEETKIALADWALQADADGKLDSIKENVASWNLGEVPEFEKFMRDFWISVYKFGACEEKNNGEVLGVSEKGSKLRGSLDVKAICREDGWAPATFLEMDTYGLAEDAFESHVFWKKHGDVEYRYVYDVVQKKWREAYDWENLMVGPDSLDNILKLSTFLCEGDSIGGYAVIAYKKSATDGRDYESFFCVFDQPMEGRFDEFGRLETFEQTLCDPHVYKCTESGWEERKTPAFASTIDGPAILEAAAYYANVDDLSDGRLVYVPQVMRWIKYDEELGWDFDWDDHWFVTNLDRYYAGCTAKKAGDILFVDDHYVMCEVWQDFKGTADKREYDKKIYSWRGGSEEELFGKICTEENLGEEAEHEQIVHEGGKELKNVYKYVCASDGWEKKN